MKLRPQVWNNRYWRNKSLINKEIRFFFHNLSWLYIESKKKRRTKQTPQFVGIFRPSIKMHTRSDPISLLRSINTRVWEGVRSHMAWFSRLHRYPLASRGGASSSRLSPPVIWTKIVALRPTCFLSKPVDISNCKLTLSHPSTSGGWPEAKTPLM